MPKRTTPGSSPNASPNGSPGGSPNGLARGLPPALRQSTPWHAVSVVPGRWGCEAARALGGVRYLSKDAPRLPLVDCGAPASCSCAYKHHLDRRGRPRRKDEMLGLRRSGYVVDERRVTRGRREDDY
jgi:hypothetical protein